MLTAPASQFYMRNWYQSAAHTLIVSGLVIITCCEIPRSGTMSVPLIVMELLCVTVSAVAGDSWAACVGGGKSRLVPSCRSNS